MSKAGLILVHQNSAHTDHLKDHKGGLNAAHAEESETETIRVADEPRRGRFFITSDEEV